MIGKKSDEKTAKRGRNPDSRPSGEKGEPSSWPESENTRKLPNFTLAGR